jgi:hypothetical protein
MESISFTMMCILFFIFIFLFFFCVCHHVKNAVEKLTILIQSSAWNAFTPFPPKPQSINLPSYMRDLIVQKRRARAVWQNNRLPFYKQIYYNFNAKLKCTLSKIKSDSFSSWTTFLVTKNGSLWRATRNCLK